MHVLHVVLTTCPLLAGLVDSCKRHCVGHGFGASETVCEYLVSRVAVQIAFLMLNYALLLLVEVSMCDGVTNS